MKGLISVIIRAYNSAGFVEGAVESVLQQAINPDLYEIIVVDDGSTDETKEILKRYKDKIKLVELEHIGNHIKVLNIGISKAEGKYIILLDADDLFLPGILEKMFFALENKKNADFVYSDYYERNTATGDEKLVSLKGNIFESTAGGIMFRRKMLQELGPYEEGMIFPEYDMLIRAKNKYKGFYIAEPLYIYLRHQGSITADKEKVNLGKEQLFKKYGKIKGLKEY